MKSLLSRYGKQAFSLAVLTGLLILPMAVGANPDYTGNLDKVMGNTGLPQTDLSKIIGSILSTLLAFLGVLLVGIFLWAGFKWMTAGGDKDAVGKAQKLMFNAVVGLMIIFAAYAITRFVMTTLTSVAGGTTNTNF